MHQHLLICPLPLPFPTPGRNMHTIIIGTSPVAIPSGTFTVSVYFHGFRVWTTNADVCPVLTPTCPAPAGPVSIIADMKLPTLAPRGRYTLKMSFTAPGPDGAAVELMCIGVEFAMEAGQPLRGVYSIAGPDGMGAKATMAAA